MSIDTPLSRASALVSRRAPTYAEAYALIDGFTDLSLPRRRLLKTALRTAQNLAGDSAGTTRLDPVRSLALIDKASPVALGIKAGTLANRRAGVRYVLRRLGLLAPRRRTVPPIADPVWSERLASLPKGREFGRLRAFAAYCVGIGTSPEKVSNQTLDGFAEDRAGSFGGTRARERARRVASQWNRAAREIPGWPKTRLGLTAVPLQRTLPFEAYPEPLRMEANTYLAKIGETPQTLFSGNAQKPVRPSTVSARKYGLRSLLFGAVQSGYPAEGFTCLHDAISLDSVKASLIWHHARKGGQRITADLVQMAATVASIANYLNLPEKERDPLLAALREIKVPRREGLTESNIAILNALDDPRTRACLLHLPQHLMRKATRLRDGWVDEKTKLVHASRPAHAAWLASTAVAIEVLLHAPIRIENLFRLRIGQELRLANAGRSSWRCTLLINGATTKNGIGLEVPLAGDSLALIRDYLDAFRPALPHAGTAWLFPGETSADRPRHKGAFGLSITQAIHESIGIRINPHAFRAIAGSFILEANPQAIDDVRAMLGHSSFETALTYYRRFNQRAAAERLSAELTRQRRSSTALASSALLAPLRRGKSRRRS